MCSVIRLGMYKFTTIIPNMLNSILSKLGNIGRVYKVGQGV